MTRRVEAALALWQKLDHEHGTVRRRRLTSLQIVLLLQEMSPREQRDYYREVQRRLKAEAQAD